MPRIAAFTVGGVFEAGVPDHDSSLALVHLADASDLKGLDGAAEGVALKFDDPLLVREFAAAQRGTLDPDWRYSDWTEEYRNLFTAMRIEKLMMSIILLMIVGVAAFNIVASLMMVVIDKQKDIAILRTYGLDARRVARIFIVQGAAIGLVGALLGVGLGLALAYNIDVVVPWLEQTFGFQIMPGDVYYVTALPSEVQLFDVVAVPAGRVRARDPRDVVSGAARGRDRAGQRVALRLAAACVNPTSCRSPSAICAPAAATALSRSSRQFR